MDRLNLMKHLILVALLCGAVSAQGLSPTTDSSIFTITGSVACLNLPLSETPKYVKVAALSHHASRTPNHPQPLQKREVLGANTIPGSYPLLPGDETPAISLVTAVVQSSADNYTRWEFELTVPGNDTYSFLAFEVKTPDQPWMDFESRQMLGFWKAYKNKCPPSAYSGGICTSMYTFISSASNAPQTSLDDTIYLTAPTMLPENVNSSVTIWSEGYGRLTREEGILTLYLHGNAHDRGYAHGYLLAPQIVDMVEYFLLEDMIRDIDYYTTRLLPAVKMTAAQSPALRDGLKGMMAGLVASKQSLVIPSLHRNITEGDLLVLNTYGDSEAFAPYSHNFTVLAPTGSRSDACSQFVFWGDSTVDGGTITGRNMDGEADIRKVTVNNLIQFVIRPTDGGSGYVHYLWPGFLGASSGLNENGFYLMENAGCNPPGPPTPGLFLLRDVIASLLMSQNPSKATDPRRDMEAGIVAMKASEGGSCVNGCILVGASASGTTQCSHVSGCGWVYEGDRYGGATRTAGNVPPMLPHAILATNHYWAYGVDPNFPEQCNGANSSFSSLWRYEAGKDVLEGRIRSGQRLSIGQSQMEGLLQTVSHGTTEHSLITWPDTGDIAVSVAGVNGMWDAPYQVTWARFNVHELLAKLDDV